MQVALKKRRNLKGRIRKKGCQNENNLQLSEIANEFEKILYRIVISEGYERKFLFFLFNDCTK